MPDLPGVILAGGQSARMGGGDKGMRHLAGRPLIAHVAARLAPQCGPLALNANGDPERFAGLGLPVLGDTTRGHAGPLAGVLAAMDWAAGLGAAAVVTAACDTPFLPEDLVARLEAAAGPLGLAHAASGGQRHRTVGLWPVALREDLRAALEGGLRKIALWTDPKAPGVAAFPVIPVDPFFNINTPEDLAEAERLMG